MELQQRRHPVVVPEDEQGVEEMGRGVFDVEETMGLLDPERVGRPHPATPHRSKDDQLV